MPHGGLGQSRGTRSHRRQPQRRAGIPWKINCIWRSWDLPPLSVGIDFSSRSAVGYRFLGGLKHLAVHASDAERYTPPSSCRSNPLQSQVAHRAGFEELMQIRIFSIGKVKADYVKLGEAEYLKRFTGSGWKIERVELDAETASANQVAVAQKNEADRMLAKLRSEDFLVVLDERGQQMGSESLAQWMQTRLDAGTKSLVFAIGGAYGWHPDIYQRADFKLSLSALTFPYQLTRLILVEQLYRAYTINQGTPYHKA